MYDEDSVSLLRHILEQKIVELGEEAAQLYMAAQQSLDEWADAGQKGNLPQDVRGLDDIDWQAILQLKAETAETDDRSSQHLSAPPVDIAPLLARWEQMEARLAELTAAWQDERPPAPDVDLSSLHRAIQDMADRLERRIQHLEGREGEASAATALNPLLHEIQASEARLRERIGQMASQSQSLPVGGEWGKIYASLQRVEDNQSQSVDALIRQMESPGRRPLWPLVITLIGVGIILAFLIYWRTETPPGLVGVQEASTRRASEATIQTQMTVLSGEATELAETAVALASAKTRISTQSTVAARLQQQAQTTATALVQNAAANATVLVQNAVATATALSRPVSGEGGEPRGTVRQTSTSSATLTLTPFPTATPIPVQGPFVITFPPDGSEFFVAPWQILVEFREPVEADARYLLLLGLGAIETFTASPDQPNPTFQYTRSFPGGALLDGFPERPGSELEVIPIEGSGGLKPGTYDLHLKIRRPGNPVADNLHSITFTIRDDAPPEAILNVSENLLRRFGPTQTAEFDRITGLAQGQSHRVRVLGRTSGFYEVAPVPNSRTERVEWVLWESTEGARRRGWAPAKFFEFVDGAALDDVPVIAPPQSE